jgi:4-amino-4-deoxy-L-arabinose transferase-like glycosyltransferase
MPAIKKKEHRERLATRQAEAIAPSTFRFDGTDAVLLALLLGFALLLIARTGFANGQELWPMPDAVEYAAMAVNLDRGLGPVVHFAGNTYPARYTIGYPLMLAAAYPMVGHQPERLCLVTAFTALLAIAGLYLLTLWMFDRASAVIAAGLLATSPYFLGLSTCVLSDVPSLAVITLAVLAFLYAEGKGSLIASALCGLLVGWAITIRVTNGAILIGMFAAVALVHPRKLDFKRIVAFALGILPFPMAQAWANAHSLGSPFANGYAFWRPDLYGSGFEAFAFRYLFAPELPGIAHGSLISYALAMLGLDGLLGQLDLGMELRTLLHSRYAWYPFPVVIFIGLGVFFLRREKRNATTMRAIYLGVGFLASLLLIYLFYFYLDPRFLMPGLFIVLAVAAYGIVSANRILNIGWPRYVVLALDLLLAGAMVAETISRLATPSPDSQLVVQVHSLRPQLANSVLVTDVSLQWLDLLLDGEDVEYVGLDNLFAEEAINEYHLHYLYEKKTAGHPWPMPPILLPDGKLDSVEAQKLADDDKNGRPVYLLVAMPMRKDWASTLMGEFGELDRAFALESVTRYPEIGLYRLKPH